MTATESTATAVSPDSGEHWSAPGAWRVAEGLHRIPLPLPMDGLKAVNVYVLETDDGLTLIDGGWAVTEGRAALEAGLRAMGAGFADIRRFLVTHVHRDHYTLASVLGEEYAAHVSLGVGDKPTLDLIHGKAEYRGTGHQLRLAGAPDLAAQWEAMDLPAPHLREWRYPDAWLDGDHAIEVGGRTLDAVHTPGHTQGHYVFADRAAEILFAGDHVLPTITPSIGFEPVPVLSPLGDFMASLTRVRALPDLRLLPAHGPIAPSSHARVDELLAHHEERLAQCLAVLQTGPCTAADVAATLSWTRHERSFESLDLFNAGLATMETKAHLELLVARGRATRDDIGEAVVFSRA